MTSQMWVVRVKDRGRDLAIHHLESRREADEVRRVYELFGYAPEKVVVEADVQERQAA